MAKRPRLAQSEMEVARVVWNLGEATVRQVHEALPNERQLDFWTVQTYLRRLASKGYLKVRREGGANIYSPAVRPRQVIREVLDDVLQRLFDGQALPLLQHLIDERGLSDEEIDELQKRLDELRRRRS